MVEAKISERAQKTSPLTKLSKRVEQVLASLRAEQLSASKRRGYWLKLAGINKRDAKPTRCRPPLRWWRGVGVRFSEQLCHIHPSPRPSPSRGEGGGKWTPARWPG